VAFLTAPLVAAGALGACSIAMPSTPQKEGWRAQADEVTSSIRKPIVDLPRGLDAEDKRRALAALATALDPQGEGGAVAWENPQTSAKGAFTPVGHAYPSDGKICRAFLAEVGAKEPAERLQGTACREKSNDWTLTVIGPWHKS